MFGSEELEKRCSGRKGVKVEENGTTRKRMVAEILIPAL